MDSLGSPFFRRALAEAVLVGALAGTVGVHVLLRRLPFFVVAMSHATFPGVVLASVAGISLFVGGTAFGLLVVLAVVALGSRRVLDQASVIGVVLAASFALGVVVLSARTGATANPSRFLVGSVLTVTAADVRTTVIVGAVVVIVLAVLHKELVLGAFDPEGAVALGYRTTVLDTCLLALVTVTLVTTVPAVGTLLAVALLTVPALAARVWAERVSHAMALAAVFGALSGAAGLSASVVWRVAAGAAIALAATGMLAVSLMASAALRSVRRPALRS